MNPSTNTPEGELDRILEKIEGGPIDYSVQVYMGEGKAQLEAWAAGLVRQVIGEDEDNNMLPPGNYDVRQFERRFNIRNELRSQQRLRLDALQGKDKTT